ncbi:aminotransferase [Psychromonas sp. B3M02]|uniref:aminotransferase class V-fold PLP-dependent enzyme n=1 Tax=Psychromonas sp. B3M02 TaxID=2267226 RepID=UPI000DE8252F|nr:aminotransferase class V-fold PLP-dependent enzyme [Psychromonas sp. B3M02]RBW43608.1 aminotransferase [Psychromonas sp. B3M02]
MIEDKAVSNERRHFLKVTSGIAAAGITAGLLPSTANAKNNHQSYNARHNKSIWNKVKKQFVLDKNTTYMNVGTTGSMPSSVLKNYYANNLSVAENPWDMQDKFGEWPYTTEMSTSIAAGLGANADEIILSRNTTDGMCSILNGLQFESGDIILTTHHEHVAAESPLHVVSERYGVEVIYLDIPVDTGDENITEQEFVDLFTHAVSEYSGRVRLITFSHITYKTGTRLPAKRICQEVAIPNEIPTLIDGAHAIGMLDLDLHDIGCDFYAGSGHKWQCGPGATGILFVLNGAQRLDQYWSDRDTSLWFINSSLGHADYLGAQLQLQYIGNDNYPAKQALADACAMWDEIGRDVIEERVLALSKRCKQQIKSAFPDAVIYSPDIDELASAITSFNPFADVNDSDTLTAFRDALREQTGFIIRTTDFKVQQSDTLDTHALRISTHLFHDEDDVDNLITAMKNVFNSMV